jgi:hypothetical protein
VPKGEYKIGIKVQVKIPRGTTCPCNVLIALNQRMEFSTLWRDRTLFCRVKRL